MLRVLNLKCFCFLLLFSFTVSGFSQVSVLPKNLPNLKFWLKADSASTVHTSGLNVTQWDDCSGNSYIVNQGNSGMQPALQNNAINGKPVIHFDGSDDFLTGGDILDMRMKSFDIYIVAKANTNSGGMVTKYDNSGDNIYAIGFAGNQLYYSFYVNHLIVNTTAGSFKVFNPMSSRSELLNKLFINFANSGITTVISNIDRNCTCNFDIGFADAAFGHFDGDIAEIIIYDTILNPTQKSQLEYYFRYKYAPPVNLGADIIIPYGFCSTILDVGAGFNTYNWSTGASTQNISVNQSGTYSVTAVDNVFGFTSSDTIHITYPSVNLPDTAIFCSGDSVLLSTGLIGAYTYQWPSGKTTPTIYAKTAGKYWVTVTDASLCSKISDTAIVVKDSFALAASLGNDLTLCSGNSIALVQPSPLPGGLIYSWTGGSNASFLAITTSGTYSVTVTDTHGCVATDSININISGIAPTPGFSYVKGCSGQVTQFTNTSSSPHDSFLWNFGDGNTSNLEDPAHPYITGGTYNVSFTVGKGGCTNTIIKPIHIPSPPLAAFTVDTACAGHDYSFNDLSIPGEGTITSWYWDFGDGTHSHAKDTIHAFSSPPFSYNISLIVQTDSGCADTTIHAITVVNTALAPSGFTLILPSDSLVTSDHIINFSWNIAPRALSYTLEYSNDPNFSFGVMSISHISATNFQTTIGVSQKYYWRVKAYGICNDSVYSNTFQFTIFSPPNLTNLELWLRADSALTIHTSGSNVTQWDDCSGNAYIVAQPVSGMQPLIQTNPSLINGKPFIHFDGSDDFLNGGDILDMHNNSFDIYMVAKANTNNGAFISKYDNSAPGVYAFAFAGNQLYYSFYSNHLIINHNPGNFKIYNPKSSRQVLQNKLYINTINTGVTTNIANIDMNTSSNFKIGSADAVFGPFDGDIAEIIIYKSILSVADRKLVEKYFDNKYGGTVNLGPDIWTDNFCDTTLYASKRFTNYLWSTGETTDSIIVNSGGTYWVSVTDVFGFPSSDTVIVHKPIVTAYSDTLCLGDSTMLHTGLGGTYVASWVTVTDSIVADSIMIHAGESVMLHVYDTYGCSVNRQIVMHTDNFPASNLLPSAPYSVCTGDIIYPLIDTSLIETYDWFDGISHSYNGYYTITQTSGFTLTLTVTNARGCKATDIVNVSIAGAQPNVSFNFTSVCFPGSGSNTFYDNSTASGGAIIDHYYWDFGDGSTANLTNSNLFSHHYDSAAYYTVTLTDTTNKGCYKSVSQLVPVYSVPKPLFQPHLGCQGVPITLNDHSTSTVGDITSWDWTFDDPYNPLVSSDTNPQHVFDSTGYYDIYLVVTTEFGCKDSIKDSIRIRYAPAVGYTYTNVCDGNPVYFSDATQTEPWALIYEWYWDFGNGATSTSENPVYTFDSAGTYNVALSVHSINGCVASDTQQVVVHAIPAAALVINDYCAQTPYILHDTSSVLSPDSITSWLWDFGSLGTSNASTPSITFNSPGDYPVSLTIASNAGCEDIITDIIHVFPVPTATFLPSEYYCTAPCTITFTNSSQPPSGLNYLWSFGDTASTGSIQPNPWYTYNYNDSNGFPVVLYATNSYGCSDSSYVMVFVTPTTGDIMVSNVQAVKQNGFVTLSAKITNLGTRSVYSIDVYAKTAGGTAYKETMNLLTDPLMPGEDTLYTFTGQYQLSDQQVTEYICVEAQISNYVPDDDPTNNEQCLTFTTQFIAFEPYPSPVNDEVNIDFILPFEDNVVIELFGMKGDKVLDIYSGTAQKGLNKITLDVSDLALAVYTYRILFRDDQKILKFVKY